MSVLHPKGLRPVDGIDWTHFLLGPESAAFSEAYEAFLMRRFGHLRGFGQTQALPIQDQFVEPCVAQRPTIWQAQAAEHQATGLSLIHI